MSTLPPELASVLASINARLAAIEAAVGGQGGSSGSGGDSEGLSRLANDFQLSIINNTGNKLFETAEKCGDEGKRLVSIPPYRSFIRKDTIEVYL